jgi:hypothetical protein
MHTKASKVSWSHTDLDCDPASTICWPFDHGKVASSSAPQSHGAATVMPRELLQVLKAQQLLLLAHWHTLDN